jgi:three-Cys-motif partner protein
MSGSRYEPSRVDGLPARVSGPWAREKLTYLRKYMHIFSVGMKNRFPNRVYIDLLAGPGRCIEEDTLDEFDGSPLLALACEEPFTRVLLVEGDTTLSDALRSRVGDRATIFADDCNDPGVIQAIRQSLGPETLALAFIDNLGLDVPLSTIRRLTVGKRVDLCITFQTGDLRRNLESAVRGGDEARWDAFFGDRAWRPIAIDAARRNLSAAETATELLDHYGDQLRTLGYGTVRHSLRAMRNSRNVDLYRVVLAGKHPKAGEFFDKVSTIDPYGQRTLPW